MEETPVEIVAAPVHSSFILTEGISEFAFIGRRMAPWYRP